MAWKFIRFVHWRVWLVAAATLISLTAVPRPARYRGHGRNVHVHGDQRLDWRVHRQRGHHQLRADDQRVDGAVDVRHANVGSPGLVGGHHTAGR